MKGNEVPVELPPHISFLRNSNGTPITIQGRNVAVWELEIPTDEAVLRDWAARFRQHYCADSEIDKLRAGTGMSRADYLLSIVFPDRIEAPGPSIRAGDFAEILVADYLEYISGYWVPRCKYQEKWTRNESVKGVDILGFRISALDGAPSPSDTLIAFEAKAQLTGQTYSGRLQTAIDDSSKDLLRCAFTLNATKRRLINLGSNASAQIVERFQNATDRPYVYRSGAALVLSSNCFHVNNIETSTCISSHANKDNLDLIIIKGMGLLDLVHSLYERAANEA